MVKFKDEHIKKTTGCRKCEERRRLLEAGAPRLQPRHHRAQVNEAGRGVSQVSPSAVRPVGDLEQSQGNAGAGVDRGV